MEQGDGMRFLNKWDGIKTRVARHGESLKIRKIKTKNKRRVALLFSAAWWYASHLDFFLHSGLYYSNIELAVTTNCTLRCKNCCHYIPRYARTPYTPAEIMIGDLQKLLGSIRWVDEFRVLGGEPLLHPELDKIVSFLLDSKKIGRVEIVTNGTLSPSQRLLDLFPNDRLNIFVSDYGKLSCKVNEFALNQKINVTIPEPDDFWLDHGNLEFQNRTERELTNQYSKCSKDKCVMLNGILYNCASSAFGSDLKVFELKPDEYIDVHNSKSCKELQSKLSRFKRRNYFSSCNYCFWGTDKLLPIKAAEQI